MLSSPKRERWLTNDSWNNVRFLFRCFVRKRCWQDCSFVNFVVNSGTLRLSCPCRDSHRTLLVGTWNVSNGSGKTNWPKLTRILCGAITIARIFGAKCVLSQILVAHHTRVLLISMKGMIWWSIASRHINLNPSKIVTRSMSFCGDLCR